MCSHVRTYSTNVIIGEAGIRMSFSPFSALVCAVSVIFGSGSFEYVIKVHAAGIIASMAKVKCDGTVGFFVKNAIDVFGPPSNVGDGPTVFVMPPKPSMAITGRVYMSA